jgi:hypothetical protein
VTGGDRDPPPPTDGPGDGDRGTDGEGGPTPVGDRDRLPREGRRTEGVWPAPLSGVTESVVTTLGPNGLYNAAALGLHAPTEADRRVTAATDVTGTDEPAGPVTARTWGRTRTRGNFRRRGGGVVQFVTDPRTFVDAALSIRESRTPVLSDAAAWVVVEAREVAAGASDGTDWVEWALLPGVGRVRRERVPTIDRGFAAVIEATVAASRLDVPAYETAALLDRLEYFASVVESCGGPRVREAMARVDAYADWRARLDDG